MTENPSRWQHCSDVPTNFDYNRQSLALIQMLAHQHTYTLLSVWREMCVSLYVPRSSYHNPGKLLRGLSSPRVDGFLHIKALKTYRHQNILITILLKNFGLSIYVSVTS